jgi:hypothetical protein
MDGWTDATWTILLAQLTLSAELIKGNSPFSLDLQVLFLIGYDIGYEVTDIMHHEISCGYQVHHEISCGYQVG